jgi:hypothetical protein
MKIMAKGHDGMYSSGLDVFTAYTEMELQKILMQSCLISKTAQDQ